MHLKQPGFMCNGCGPFTKNKERIQKFKETEDSRYIYPKELDKACFQHEEQPEEQLLINFYVIKHLILLKIQNMNYTNQHLLQWFKIFFDKTSSGAVLSAWSETFATWDKSVIKNETSAKSAIMIRTGKDFYSKVCKMKSTFIFQRQYLGCWSSRHVVSKYADMWVSKYNKEFWKNFRNF